MLCIGIKKSVVSFYAFVGVITNKYFENSIMHDSNFLPPHIAGEITPAMAAAMLRNTNKGRNTIDRSTAP